MTRDDLFLQTLEPVTHDLGGFKVHRTLPARERTMVGPFLFFDQMGPAHLEPDHGIDVRPHPHINLATVTYLFAGAFDHRDSLGTYQRIEPGAVNLMTAGHGIAHSERSPADQRVHGPELAGIQTWLALPERDEERDPAFQHVAATQLPVVECGKATATVIMGKLWGATAPTRTYAETVYADILLEPLRLYVLRPGIAGTLRSEGGGRVMLCGGEAFATPRHVWWNFVSSRRDRIEQAKDDWRAGRFPTIPGDDAEFIPIPDVPKTVSYP